jgi:hypothetical protein
LDRNTQQLISQFILEVKECSQQLKPEGNNPGLVISTVIANAKIFESYSGIPGNKRLTQNNSYAYRDGQQNYLHFEVANLCVPYITYHKIHTPPLQYSKPKPFFAAAAHLAYSNQIWGPTISYHYANG